MLPRGSRRNSAYIPAETRPAFGESIIRKVAQGCNPMLKNLTSAAGIQGEKMARSRMLTITMIAAIIAYLLWNVDALSPLMYPFRLFVTYVHEAGHSLMALLTGGKVLGFTVSSNGSGLAITSGGSRALILPAGYLGAAFFGTILFYILNTRPYARTISIILGIGLVVFTLMYARPDKDGAPIALLVGLLAGLGLVGLGWKVAKEVNLLVLNVLAIMAALNAVLDIIYLTKITRVTDAICDRSGGAINDAAAFTCDVARGIPPVVWAFLWAGIAVAMMGAALYYSLLRPMLQEADKLIQKSESDSKLDAT